MKRYAVLVVFIALILFILPFFWLKSGEMDLGGDSSRLYFYDPFSYLLNHVLYGIVPTDKGGEAVVAYALFPYVFTLFIIKKIIHSPTMLISLTNGINISVAFLFTCLTVKELLKPEKISSELKVTIAAVLAGLAYVFSPYNTLGWDRVILTRSQIFLNPLMFYLLLRYVSTHKKAYMVTALILTFIFSINFSYLAAPPFFAFYPLSLLFLLLYIKYILNRPIPTKGLLISLIAFLGLQAFHLVPNVLSIFSSDSPLQQAIISNQAKLSRGLDYFLAVAPSLKASISFLNLAQSKKFEFIHFFFFIYPTSLLFGLLLRKRKTILLTTLFFLIALFFATANITNLGFTFYKYLFYIPGFSMFRSVDGQWGFVFLFFYCILLGQAWGIIFNKLRLFFVSILTIYVVVFIAFSSIPFITGMTIRRTHHQTQEVKPIIRMDPIYEKTLGFIGSLPDVKLLSFPLADGGYQGLQGATEGVYIGPPIASYLRGKNDFTSYDSLSPFNEEFINAVYEKNTPLLTPLLSVLNIGYIFHNSDPYIYDDTFSGYPYTYVRDYLSKNQEGYKHLIKELPVDLDKKIDFGEKYHLYPIKKDLVFPHIYSTSNNIYSTDARSLLFSSQLTNMGQFAIYSLHDFHGTEDSVVLEAKPNSPFLGIKNNYHLHKHNPFISTKLNSIFYPLTLLKEKFDLRNNSETHEKFLDYSLLLLSKRILELRQWNNELAILEKSWEPLKIWEFYKIKNYYNSWEAGLTRYENGIGRFINLINKSNLSDSLLEEDKIKINEQLFQHQRMLMRVISQLTIEKKYKEYLLKYSDEMFRRIFSKLDLKEHDSSTIHYRLQMPENSDGEYEYEIFMESPGNISNILRPEYLGMDDIILKPQATNNDTIKSFGKIRIKNKKTFNILLHVSSKNIIEEEGWQSSGKIETATSSSELKIQNIFGDNSGGIIKLVDGWVPNKQYIVSFDYLTFGKNFIFQFNERIGEGKDTDKLFEKNLNSVDWKTQQSIVSSDINSQDAYLQFFPDPNNKNITNLRIKNLKVIEIVYPKLFFVKRSEGESIPPTISFIKINPTKYKIKVSNASLPYTLVFLESFSQNWQLVNPKEEGKAFWNLLLTNPFPLINLLSEHAFPTVQSDTATNVFLGATTFETLGKKVIAGDRHFFVNGYANAWHIVPDDVSGKQDYELVLELKTQTIFYLSLVFSFCFLAGCMILLVKILLGRGRQKYGSKQV